MSQNYDYIEQFNNELPLNLYKKDDIESKAIGNYLNKIQSMTDILESDINPITCKYKGLVAWENFFKLPSNNLENIDFRRAKVLSELIQYMSDENVIRKDEMETILNLYANNVSIREYCDQYAFTVSLELINTMKKNNVINNVQNVLQIIKPSYLNYNLSIALRADNANVFGAAILMFSEVITVYPYAIEDIKEKEDTFFGLSFGTMTEIIEVSSKGGNLF